MILLPPHIPYPSRMNQEKRQEKDEVQIHKFWQMFKQLHINISLADALVLIPKYQKMLKSLLSNKEKLLELANTPLNENCSAVILKKLPEKLGDPEKFLIPCSFSELKCKALADLGASTNLMPLLVWKKLGLPELISTCMTLELANRQFFVHCNRLNYKRCLGSGLESFTIPPQILFIVLNMKAIPPVVPFIWEGFLTTARSFDLAFNRRRQLILRDGNERLTLNMRHDTSNYSTQPHQESINMIDVYNISHEEILKDLFATNHLSGNPTSSLTSHIDLTSLEVNDDIFDPEGDIIENLLNLDKTKDLPPYHDNPLSGSTTSSHNSPPNF
ncbi:reverse transcriptase domain-containing protein [Tanacetum coccineum]